MRISATSKQPLHDENYCFGECPLCGITSLEWRFKKKDRDFWRCMKCGIELQHPLPKFSEIQAYYDREYAHGMYDTFTAAAQMKTMTARQRLKGIKPFVNFAGHWLDIGCADGVFINEASALGMKVSGVELSPIAVDMALAKGLDVTCGDITNLITIEKYDCITGFDVIEHVLDPRALIAEIVSRLKPGGYIVLTTPDIDSIFCRLMGSRWWFYIPEEHFHLFNQNLVKRLLELHGFEIIKSMRSFKPLTYNYGLTQFIEYNPLIHRAMKTANVFIPNRLRKRIIPLYIGEMLIIGRLAMNDIITKKHNE